MESLTNMPKIDIRAIILAIITKLGGGYSIGNLKHTVVKSDDLNRFLVIRTGWYQGKNYYGTMQDIELVDGKVCTTPQKLDSESGLA